MRLTKEHVQFIVNWILCHPEIDGFSIWPVPDRPWPAFRVHLNFGTFSQGFSMAFDRLQGDKHSAEAILREELESAWLNARHYLPDQYPPKDSPI
jgi:hypothetical protein